MYSIEELANDFRKLGIRAGETLMLYASVRAVGEVVGGPDCIHLALKSVLPHTDGLQCRCLGITADWVSHATFRNGVRFQRVLSANA